MIWHIFRKDLRLSWKLALLAVLLQWLATAVIVKMGLFWTHSPLPELRIFVRQAATLATCLVVIAAVHHDALPSPTADWLMRPIRRRDMLLAKFLFFLVAVQLPVLAGFIAEGMAFGLGFGESFWAAAWQSAMLTLGFGIPVLALAAVTASMLQAIVAAVAGAAIFSAMNQLAFIFAGSGNGLRGTYWIASTGMYGGMFLAGALALGIQYHRRHTLRARFVSGAVFVLGISAALIPWKTAFAIQRQFSPVPDAASNVRLFFDPRPPLAPVDARPPLTLNRTIILPIQTAGLAPGTTIVANRVEVRLAGPGGSSKKVDAQLLPFSPREIRQYVEVPAAVRSDPSATVLISGDYWLTLIKETGTWTVPKTDGDTRIPPLGNCSMSLMPAELYARFGCAHAGPFAGVCLQRVPEERTVPTCLNYAPRALWLPDWDEISHPPIMNVGSPPTKNTITIKTYEIVDHFVRHLDIPNIRLADWGPERTSSRQR